MNEKEDFFVKKEFLSEESTTVLVYSGDSVAKSLDSTPYAKKHYKTLSYIEKFILNISKTSDNKCSKFVSFPFDNNFIFFRWDIKQDTH
ncbi:hypothetical protein Avbf_07837 [Armadillidium vulgare]|nr:hypothetical protein Avbf_07837 [Armadillidium vulgare]